MSFRPVARKTVRVPPVWVVRVTRGVIVLTLVWSSLRSAWLITAVWPCVTVFLTVVLFSRLVALPLDIIRNCCSFRCVLQDIRWLVAPLKAPFSMNMPLFVTLVPPEQDSMPIWLCMVPLMVPALLVNRGLMTTSVLVVMVLPVCVMVALVPLLALQTCRLTWVFRVLVVVTCLVPVSDWVSYLILVPLDLVGISSVIRIGRVGLTSGLARGFEVAGATGR